MTKDLDYEIALSFAGEDREYVDQVANFLKNDNIKVFYDIFEEANLWGKNLYDYLCDIYQNKALYTIMFISEYYAKKLWPNHERQAMQARAFQENSEYILPARFDKTIIPGVLPTIGFIDLTTKTPLEFVKIIKRKLVYSGRTIPSEQIRKAVFSVEKMSKQNPIISEIVIIDSDDNFISNATITAIADNNTTLSGVSDENGLVKLQIFTRRNYTLLISHPHFGGVLVEKWDPEDKIKIKIPNTENTGSIICHSTCYIPNFDGRLNIIFDTSFRTYLYADNIALTGQSQQPYTFKN